MPSAIIIMPNMPNNMPWMSLGGFDTNITFPGASVNREMHLPGP